MKIAAGRGRFEQVLADRGMARAGLDADSLVDAMLWFYANVRATDAAPFDEDGDLLLFQWGTYDWGRARLFEFDLTRQWAERRAMGDDGLWQLQATLRYEPSSETEQLASGSQWCFAPDAVEAFRAYIAGSDARAFAAAHSATQFEVTFDPVS